MGQISDLVPLSPLRADRKAPSVMRQSTAVKYDPEIIVTCSTELTARYQLTPDSADAISLARRESAMLERLETLTVTIERATAIINASCLLRIIQFFRLTDTIIRRIAMEHSRARRR